MQRGCIVYLVDQPARGRSAYLPRSNGNLATFPAEPEEKLFTDLARQGTWPRARLHDQLLEKNNLESADFVDGWIRRHVPQ